jgi:hypothetical protein
METETARITLYAIATIGLIAWLAGAQFLGAVYRSERAASQEAVERFDLQSPPSARLVVGSAEVDGQPAALAAKAAAILAKGGTGPLGPVKILKKTDDRIEFEGTGGSVIGQPSWRSVRRGQMQFLPGDQQRTRINYAVELCGANGYLIAGAVFSALGLVAVIGGFVLIDTLVLSNPNPGVRAQAIQMVQAVHFLWPPFLFGWLYRASRRSLRVGLEVFVNNLPFYA